jgi:hypothetical protein
MLLFREGIPGYIDVNGIKGNIDARQKMLNVSGGISRMHVYEEEIQLNGRDGAVVNAVASIHLEKDAQIPDRVLGELWKIIKAINLEEAVTIASAEAATSSTMTPRLVTSRIIHIELEFYCPLYPGEDVLSSESLYPGGTQATVHIRIKQVGED